LADGQLYGGLYRGLGYALIEDTHYEEETGELTSKGYITDFKMLTSDDLPEVNKIEVRFTETYEPTGPFGAKGVGEPALIPSAPAILNAIADAIGQRIYHLPANLERVLEAVQKGKL